MTPCSDGVHVIPVRNANGAGTPRPMASCRHAHSGSWLLVATVAMTARAVASTLATAANRSSRASERCRRGSTTACWSGFVVIADQRAAVTAMVA